jgi:hypothetical protein
MRAVLGLVFAALAASLLLGLGASQALATTVHCGDVITQDAKLDADLLGCADPALTIDGSDVTLDLNGHTVDGGIYGDGLRPVSGGGFSASPRAVVENGTVTNGVRLRDYNNMTIQNLTVDRIEANRGIHLIQNNLVDGGYIACDRGRGEIKDNILRNSGISAVYCSPTVTGNLIDHGSIGLLVVGHPTLIGNTIRHSSSNGISLQDGSFTAIQNVITDSALDGVRLRTVERGRPTTIRENVILRSGGDGVNTDRAPGLDLADNRIDRNGDDGIDVDPRGTIIGNHVWWNQDLGIQSVPGVRGFGNWAKHNGNTLQCVPTYLCSTTGRPR